MGGDYEIVGGREEQEGYLYLLEQGFLNNEREF